MGGRFFPGNAATVLVFAALIATTGASAVPLGASTHAKPGGHPITICHRTDSETNPYVQKTVDASSTAFHGHEGHTGGVWFNGHPKEPKWGDIIPPTDDDKDLSVTPMNWSTMGQAIWKNDCMSPFGPPPGKPTVTCNLISIDPPPTTWIFVTFVGTVNGAPFTRTVEYGNPTPHIAEVGISDLTNGPGPFHIVVYAVWTLGPGQSEVADVTITCDS